MTIITTQSRVTYAGDGVSTLFAVPFEFFLNTDLTVSKTAVGGASSTLVLNVDYTLTSAGVPGGGSLTKTTALLTGETLAIFLNPPITQQSHYISNSPFPAATLENDIDRQTQISQRLTDLITRSLRAPDSDPSSVAASFILPSAIARANTFLTFDVNGNPAIAASLPSGTLSQASIGAFLYPQTAAEGAAGVAPSNFAINSDFMDPRRYGAVGDGVTDDTVAINKWIAVWNASANPVSLWPRGFNFLVGLMNNMTSNGGTWVCYSTLTCKANATTGTSSWLTISGTGLDIRSVTFNGNQAAYSAQAGNALVYFNGCTDLLLDGVSFINGAVKGALFYQVNGARISNCHFDNNANLGLETNAASYVKFINCTLNYNGYGFQKTLATNIFAAFGLALRFRTHHFTFTNCEAKQNGRDGLCTNQGSYAIKYIGCLAWMNGDGGFTIAADQQSTGLLGDGESCYDLEYIDCESYNNWSSGLSAYAPAYNVTIEGGRYYNNNREAGQLALASSYISGIYFAAGSLGIRVRAKAYDDRQVAVVNIWSNPTAYLPTWVAGTAANYPRVAFYNSAGVFQGYGTIANEAGSPNVSFSTAPNNGVNLASVGAGWYVSQRVQHNGAFFDNNCQGSVDVDGFGFLPGPVGYSGYKSVSGYLANGQNMLLPGAPLDYTELLANPTWDAATTNWTYSVVGGSANLFTTAGTLLRSPGCLQLVAGGGNTATGDSTLIAGALNYVQGAYIEASVWCYAVNPGDATLFLYWTNGSQFFSTASHPGGGWKQLKVGAFMGNSTTGLFMRVTNAVNKTNYWDNASLRVKTDPTDGRDFTYPSRNLPV